MKQECLRLLCNEEHKDSCMWLEGSVEGWVSRIQQGKGFMQRVSFTETIVSSGYARHEYPKKCGLEQGVRCAPCGPQC